MRIKITKDCQRWIICVIVLGVLYLLGDIDYQVTNPNQFLLILTVLSFLLILAFWFLREGRKTP